MTISGEGMRLILETRRRLNQMRGPLIEGMDDGNIGGLGQDLTAAWSELRDAFVTVEEVLRLDRAAGCALSLISWACRPSDDARVDP